MPKTSQAKKDIINRLLKAPHGKTWAQLTAETSLSKSTMSVILNQLIKDKVVKTEVTSSRPPKTLYMLRPDAFSMRTSVALAISPISKQKKTQKPAADPPPTAEEYVEASKELGKKALENPSLLKLLIRSYILGNIFEHQNYLQVEWLVSSKEDPYDLDARAEQFSGSSTSLLQVDQRYPGLRQEVRAVRLYETDEFSAKEWGLEPFRSEDDVIWSVKDYIALDTRLAFQDIYKIDIREEEVKKVIEELLTDKAFTIGRKNHYGIRSTSEGYNIYDEEDLEVHNHLLGIIVSKRRGTTPPQRDLNFQGARAASWRNREKNRPSI